jgi:geranylgeranyl pyrophosphate synthase
VASLLREHQCWTPAKQTIRQYVDSARRCLAALPSSEGQTLLGRLADYLEAQVAALESGQP